MTFRQILAVLATTAVMPLGATLAQATPLSTLVAGTTLIQGDVTFDGFFFDDRFGDDETSGLIDRTESPLAGDRSVDASQIEITTSSTASSVTLTATINPAISIADEGGANLPHIFDFFLDFSVSVSSTSSRVITGVTLGGGDLFATRSGVSEVIYDIVGLGGLNDLEIFDAPSLSPSSQTSQSQVLADLGLVDFRGRIEGDTRAGDTAGLSSYSLTFDLAGTPPPLDGVVPVPPALPLALTAFAGFALLRRARRG
jgi:hypothetical protein